MVGLGILLLVVGVIAIIAGVLLGMVWGFARAGDRRGTVY